MSHLKVIMRFLGVITLTYVGIFVMVNLLYLLSPFGGYDLLLLEFIGGFWFFLRENLPSISFDAGTWAPGLGAFLLAMVVAHRFLAAWAATTNRHWSFATTFCLLLTVPVMFVISFIIPGVLLQWEMLRQVIWLTY